MQKFIFKDAFLKSFKTNGEIDSTEPTNYALSHSELLLTYN